MVPVALARTTSFNAESQGLSLSVPWLRPANTTAEAHAQIKTLVRWLACAVLLGVAIALLHVWLRLQVVNVGYHLSTTRQVIEKLENEGHELTLQAARLSASTRIDKLARERLGMIRAENGQEVVLP